MSQAAAQQPGAAGDPDAYEVRKVDSHARLGAAQRLAEASAQGDKDAGKRFLAAARTHGIDLEHFWSSCDTETGRVREVALGVRGSGRTAMCFTSQPGSRASEQELGRVIDALCDDLRSVSDPNGVRLAQALLNPGERAAARAFTNGGFHELARLAYMGRPVPTPGEFEGFEPWQLPADTAARSLATLGPEREETTQRLLIALTRSYEQTLDCPELCTLRSPEDVLDSHRSVRRFDPRWWWLIELNGEPEGAMLFTACPDSGGVELVYLGISPRLRGRGLGRVLMRSGMRELAFGLTKSRARERARLTCAVDLHNEPARRLYRGLGFQMTAERVAMVRAIGTR
jgi:ribosomal protein S18 acetylase RimI-like enzyme